MTNNKQNILLVVAAAWFAKPSYAGKVTSTWTNNRIGSNSDRSELERLQLHVELKRQVHGLDRDLMADEQTFIGPGVMECSKAVCTFEVDESLGCADPCHTVSSSRMYEYPFYTFSDVGDPYHEGSSNDEDDICYYRNATDINTWKPELAQIDEGCTAHCTGCIFASPVVPISGPTRLQCTDARCTKYVHGETFGCGTAIEAASGAYGTLSTLPDGEHIAHEFHGYEGINGSFEIPDTCNLECTGCISVKIGSGTKTTSPTGSTGTSTTSATAGTDTTSTSTSSSAAAPQTSAGTESTSSTGTESTSPTATENAGTEFTTGTESTSSTGTESTSPTTTENTSTGFTTGTESTSSTGTESTPPTTTENTRTEITTGTESTSSTGTESTSPTTTENASTGFTTGTESTSSTGTESTSPTTTENASTDTTSVAPETTEKATTGTEFTSSTGIHLRGGTRRRKA